MSYSRWGSSWAPGSWGAAWGESGSATDALTASDLISVSVVTQASISQVVNLTSDDVLCSSSIEQPTLGTSHTLQASPVIAQASVDQGSLGQTYELGGKDSVAASRVSQARLRQTQHFISADVTASAVVQQLPLGVVYVLEAAELLSDSQIENATLTITGHTLNADNIVSSSEVALAGITQIQQLRSYTVLARTTIRRSWAWQFPREGQILVNSTDELFTGPFPMVVEAEDQDVIDGLVRGVEFKLSHRCSVCGNLYKANQIRWFQGKPYGMPCEDYKDIATEIRRRSDAGRLATIGRKE